MTDVDDARTVVAQLLHVLRGVRDGEADDGAEVEVPLALRDLGPVELSPEGVQARLETLVAGACRALLTALDVHGLPVEEALERTALALAALDQPT